MILIVDFGSQTTHLIGRRLKDLGVKSRIIDPKDLILSISEYKPNGIILSGGPASVYEKGAPTINSALYKNNLPILGICYGFQLTAKILGGKVIPGKKEYGPATLELKDKNKTGITKNIKEISTVWVSHGDSVLELPRGFEVLGSTETVPYAFVKKNNILGVQFHPEIEHTKEGNKILKNFINLCNLKTTRKTIGINALLSSIKNDIGENYVIGAISGGVDSTVAGILASHAIGKKFIPIYVENGLMREGTKEHVEKIFESHGIKPIIVNCEKEMLVKLKGITDPEEKRKIIGNFYIEVFERELKNLQKAGNKNITHLLQGTIYSDVIESQGTRNSSKIKSHHNVGGLPENMKLKLLEPLKLLYKDEVRKLGKKLGIADEFIYKQPFPGPGYAIRIRGEITPERLKQQKLADKIILEELEKTNLLKKIFISFPILTGSQSTAVKGDGRFFGEVIAIRIVESNDVMSASWAKIPHTTLQTISSRIVNEVPNISRVVYDITTKPPATMEWE